MSASGKSRVEQIKDVLNWHFAGLDEGEIIAHAHQLDRTLATAGALQSLERSNTDPAKDREKILKAAKNIAVAKKALASVGWHGQKALIDVVLPLVGESDRQFLQNSGSRFAAKDQINTILEQLEDGLSAAIQAVDLDGKSVMSDIRDHPQQNSFNKSKPRETLARGFAAKCAQKYYQITGLMPTVRTGYEEVSHTAYGPFFEFVKDVFPAAGITASPETWAREAVKEFSPKSVK